MNCWRTLSVGVALGFFKVLFKIFTNLSVCQLDFGWYRGIVGCSIWYVSQKSVVRWSFSKMFTFIWLIYSSWRASCFIFSSIIVSSLTVLQRVVFNSPSDRREMNIVSSSGSLYLGINLENPSAWPNFFNGRYSILKL